MLIALPALSPDTIESLFRPGLRFRGRGTMRQRLPDVQQAFPEFPLAEVGPVPAPFAAIPLLMSSPRPSWTPRNTIRGRRVEGRRTEIVMVATVIAGIWSLMSGTVVALALQALLHALIFKRHDLRT